MSFIFLWSGCFWLNTILATRVPVNRVSNILENTISAIIFYFVKSKNSKKKTYCYYLFCVSENSTNMCLVFRVYKSIRQVLTIEYNYDSIHQSLKYIFSTCQCLKVNVSKVPNHSAFCRLVFYSKRKAWLGKLRGDTAACLQELLEMNTQPEINKKF